MKGISSTSALSSFSYANLLAADHPPGSPFVLRSSPSVECPSEALGQLGCAPEDLKDVEQTWSSRLTRETRQSFTRNFIKRQDLIWGKTSRPVHLLSA